MVIRCSIRSSMAAPPSPRAASASGVLHMDQPSAIRHLHIGWSLPSFAEVVAHGPGKSGAGGPRPQFGPGAGYRGRVIAGRGYRAAELSRGGVIGGRGHRGAEL